MGSIREGPLTCHVFVCMILSDKVQKRVEIHIFCWSVCAELLVCPSSRCHPHIWAIHPDHTNRQKVNFWQREDTRTVRNCNRSHLLPVVHEDSNRCWQMIQVVGSRADKVTQAILTLVSCFTLLGSPFSHLNVKSSQNREFRAMHSVKRQK